MKSEGISFQTKCGHPDSELQCVIVAFPAHTHCSQIWHSEINHTTSANLKSVSR